MSDLVERLRDPKRRLFAGEEGARRIEALEKALWFYADRKNWDPQPGYAAIDSVAVEDAGAHARAALEAVAPMIAAQAMRDAAASCAVSPKDIIINHLSTFYDRDAVSKEIIAGLLSHGYKIVAREPTEEMVGPNDERAPASLVENIREYKRKLFRGMWDAAP